MVRPARRFQLTWNALPPAADHTPPPPRDKHRAPRLFNPTLSQLKSGNLLTQTIYIKTQCTGYAPIHHNTDITLQITPQDTPQNTEHYTTQTPRGLGQLTVKRYMLTVYA